MTNRPDMNAQIARLHEVGEVRRRLFEMLAEWEAQVNAPMGELRYAPLADKADAFIEAVMELSVKRVRADMREPSRVHAAPLTYDEAAAGLGHVE